MLTRGLATAPLSVGLDERWDQAEQATSLLDNWAWDPRGGWETTGTALDILEPDDLTGLSQFNGEGRVDSIHTTSGNQGARQLLFWEQGGELRALDGPNNSWVTLATGRATNVSPWARTQSYRYGSWVYFVNGVDDAIRVNDDLTVRRAGYAVKPGAPRVFGPDEGYDLQYNQSTGLGLGLGQGDTTVDTYARYRWLYVYVNDIGTESPPSQVSNEVFATLVASATPLVFAARVHIPKGPDGTVAIKVYRTRNYYRDGNGSLVQHLGSRFFYSRTFEGGSAVEFTDMMPDDDLTTELLRPEADVEWAVGARLGCVFGGRVLLAGFDGEPDIIRYSQPGRPESFLVAGGRLPVSGLDGSEITAMYPTKRAVIVFKTRGVYVVTLGPRGDLQVATLDEGVGTISPNAITEIPGMGLAFVHSDGISVVTGAFSDKDDVIRDIVPVSGRIPDSWDTISRGSLGNAHAATYAARSEAWFALPTNGATENSIVLVLHYETGAWSIRRNTAVTALAPSRDRRQLMFMGSVDGTVSTWSHYKLNAGSQIETPWFRPSGAYEESQITELAVRALAYGNDDVVAKVYVDHSDDARLNRANEQTLSLAVRQQHENEILPVWDNLLWGQEGKRWTRAHEVVLRFSMPPKVAGRAFKVRLTTKARTQIIGWRLESSIRAGQQKVNAAGAKT